MDHSLKISGPSTQEWELVKHCLWISFLFPFWISSWIILRAALLAFGCVSGKAQAQKDVTFNNRLYPDTHHPDFPFLLLAHRLPALLAPPPPTSSSTDPFFLLLFPLAVWPTNVLRRGWSKQETMVCLHPMPHLCNGYQEAWDPLSVAW